MEPIGVKEYLFAFGLTLVLTLALTPLMRRLALRFGVMDQPTGHKSHISPVPYLGGVALALALLASVIFQNLPLAEVAVIFAGALIVSLMGTFDDKWELGPLTKIAIETLAVGVVFWGGIQIEVAGSLFLGFLVTLAWFLLVMNALNLMDNMDGLSAGIATMAALSFFIIAAVNGQFLVAGLSAALAGACIGFLAYNFYPARIFMGDAGSLFLGFVLAVIGVKLRFTNIQIVTVGVPILVLALPLFDTALVVFSRFRAGRKVYVGGRDHISHRLARMGLSVPQVAVTLYLVSAACGLLALVLAYATPTQALGLLGALILLAEAVALVLLRIRVYPLKDEAGERAEETAR